jgi:hypothetical protein
VGIGGDEWPLGSGGEREAAASAGAEAVLDQVGSKDAEDRDCAASGPALWLDVDARFLVPGSVDVDQPCFEVDVLPAQGL